jgi:hypothetical protein
VQALAGILTPVQKTALARLLPSRGRATEVERRPFLTARNIIALDYLLGRKPREIRDEEPASLEQRLNGAGQGAGARSGLVGATQDR